MQRIRPDVDVIRDVLNAVLEAQPDSTFVQSLLKQYDERGGLSKKQLQGLLGKASKFDFIPEARLATLEAIILKKATKYRSTTPIGELPEEKDDSNLVKADIEMILAKYPAHKRVLFLQAKLQTKEPLTATEIAELQRFKKLLIKD